MSSTIDKLAWVRVENGRVLCACSRGKDLYYVPGGKRDPGESDAQALIREVSEELTVRLKPESIAYYGTFQAQAHGKPEGVMVQMTCYTADYEGTLVPASEVAEIAWLSYAERDRVSGAGQLIFDHLKEKGLLGA